MMADAVKLCGREDAVKVFLNPLGLSQRSIQLKFTLNTSPPCKTKQKRLPFCAIRPSRGMAGLMSANQPVKLTMLMLLGLLLLSCGVGSILCSTVPENSTDMLSLLDFKQAITNDPSRALISWNASFPFCKWKGVTCSPKHPGRVMMLDLAGQSLSGPITASLGNLTFLRVLNLSENGFSGELPPLNHLHRLEMLKLAKNILHGVIPDTLTNCSSLEVLDLSANFLTHEIPVNVGLLSNLWSLQLSSNNLTGLIPPTLKNISQLGAITLADNQLTGGIPEELGQLPNMMLIFLGGNRLSGGIPHTIFNLSSLQYLSLELNMLHGELPSNMGDMLPDLQLLILGTNRFGGHVPASLGNALGLNTIDLSSNNFIGQVPRSFGKLQMLTYLNLAENNLEARDSESWDFIDKLSNCSSLEVLSLSENQLQGAIPNSLGKLPTSLQQLQLDLNNLSGIVPKSIGNLIKLFMLSLSSNNLNGSIEEWVGNLKALQGLYLDSNNFMGPIPSSIGNLNQLAVLSLAKNEFEGLIPSTLGKLPLLSVLNLTNNNLHGNIPREIFRTTSTMTKCVLSYNNLEGPIPQEISNLKQLNELYLSSNKLTGQIPVTLGECQQLQKIQMEQNILTGNIPSSLSNLKSLSMLNLSHNNLSGSIPIALGDLPLTQLDLSYNNLDGEIPRNGIFENATVLTLGGNWDLCGGVFDLHMPSCPTASRRTETQYYMVRTLIPIFGFMSLMLVIYFMFTGKKMAPRPYFSPSSFGEKFHKVSYKDLAQATQNFSESNLIGRGSYGSVYRGNLAQYKLEVAVKVLILDMQGAERSFFSECETLRSIQHRNLLPIITACSTVDINGNVFKALIYEFMPNGNLDIWLHHKEDGKAPRNMSLAQRVTVAANLADALDYLHNDSGRPIIHCDVKPSNILLDDDMNAHLGDFGIARFYRDPRSTSIGDSINSIGVKGTIGYIAPEYGGGGHASTCGDVYSFGIVILEMLTGKRPTDPIFANELNIVKHVEMNLPNHISRIIDASLQEECKAFTQDKMVTENGVYQCFHALLQVALSCTREFPSKRMNMREAASKIHEIKASYERQS